MRKVVAAAVSVSPMVLGGSNYEEVRIRCLFQLLASCGGAVCSSCLPKHCLQLCGTPEKCRSRCESCLWSVSTRKWCSRALGPLTSLVALHVSVSCNFSFSIVCFATLLPSFTPGSTGLLFQAPWLLQNMSFKSELSWAPHPQTCRVSCASVVLL